MAITSESIRMLETAEGQSNAVFACFGSAAQHAQMLEQALLRFFHVYNQVAKHPLSLEKLNRKTLGSLIRELEKQIKFQDHEPSKLLSTALESRNFLIHNFFVEKNEQLAFEAGRFGLLSELLSIQGHLDKGRILANAMRLALCKALRLEDPYAADYADTLPIS